MNDALRAMSARQRALTLLSWALMIFSPFLLLLIISLVLGHNVFDSYPVWSDEMDYWRSLFSWQSVGFQKGYSGMFEVIPAAGTLGVHGITPILLYGWFVKLFGLGYSSIMTCNALWVSMAALVFCALNRPRPTVALFFTALLMTYAPVVLYCVTSMTELFNYALLLFYLAFLLRYHDGRSPWMLMLCCVTVVFGCVYRITYFLLFIPVALVFSRFRFGWRMALSLLLSAVLSILCYALTSRTTAPYIQGFLYHLVRAEDLNTFVRMLLSHTKSNLCDYFTLYYAHSPIEVSFRILYCGVALLCLLCSFLRLKRDQKRPRLRVRFSWDLLACFLLLATALGIITVLYETNDWSDFRTLSPFLWLVLGYLLMRGRPVIPSIALLGSLATLVLLLSIPPVGAYNDTIRFEREADNPSVTQAAALIPYDPEAADPFVNTVRTDLPSLQVSEELHPGLGLQYGFFTTDTTGKSNWILTDQLKCVVNGYEPVLSLPGMKLYRLTQPTEVP